MGPNRVIGRAKKHDRALSVLHASPSMCRTRSPRELAVTFALTDRTTRQWARKNRQPVVLNIYGRNDLEGEGFLDCKEQRLLVDGIYHGLNQHRRCCFKWVT